MYRGFTGFRNDNCNEMRFSRVSLHISRDRDREHIRGVRFHVTLGGLTLRRENSASTRGNRLGPPVHAVSQVRRVDSVSPAPSRVSLRRDLTGIVARPASEFHVGG